MANPLTLTAAAMPAAAAGTAGMASGGNSNGTNSGSCTFANGAGGAADTVASAQLVKMCGPAGTSTNTRLYAFLTYPYANQAELDQTAAALGLKIWCNGASLFRLIPTGGPAAPTATATTAGATGTIRLAISQSVTA